MRTLSNVAPLLLLLVPIITGLLAKRKGYSFILWLFAAGPLGLIILAFLPFANDGELPRSEQARLKRRGNIMGGVLAGIAIVFGAIEFLIERLSRI